MAERELVTVIVKGREVTLPLLEAVVEFLRLRALNEERALHDDEYAVFTALVAALGTLSVAEGGAQPLYDALKQ